MSHLDYINQNYPARKTDAEKQNFRDYVKESLSKKGIVANIEFTKDGKNNNIVIGDPTSAEVVFTAHYDTPARSIFPNIMIPKNRVLFYAYQFVPIIFLLVVSFALAYIVGDVIFNDIRVYILTFMVVYYGLFFGIMRVFKNMHNYNDNTSGVATVLSIIDELSMDELNKVAFILFDNEEKGKKGSKAYFKDHAESMKDKFLVNFDCVGNGDNVIFIAQKEAKDSPKYRLLNESFDQNSNFNLEFLTHKDADSNSDHKSFPNGVACVVCKKSKRGILYTPNIHTEMDVVAENSNIEYLTKNTCVFVRNIYRNSCIFDKVRQILLPNS